METATPVQQIKEETMTNKVGKELPVVQEVKKEQDPVTAASSLKTQVAPTQTPKRQQEHQTVKTQKVEDFPGFKESCWILLTGQKPCSSSNDKSENQSKHKETKFLNASK